MTPYVFKDFNLIGPNGDFRGNALSITTPKLTETTDEHRGSVNLGAVKIRMGVELGDMTIKFGGWTPEVYTLFNHRKLDGCQFIAIGAYEDDSTCEVKSVEFTVRGRANETDLADWESGNKAESSCTFSPTYVKLEMDGQLIYEVDLQNCIYIDANGEDRFADIRRALGVQ